MKLLLKYFLHNIWEKKLRTIIITFSIMITTLLLMANLGVNEYFNSLYESNLKYTYGNTDIMITPSTSEGENQLIKENSIKLSSDNVENYTEIFSGLAKLKNKNDNYIKVNIIGANIEGLKDLDIIKNMDNGSYNGAIVSKESLDNLEVSIGEKLTLEILGENYENTIVNTADKIGVFANDDENNITIVLPMKEVQEIYKSECKVTGMYVNIKDNQKINENIEEIENDNKNINGDAVYSAESFKTQMGAINLALAFVLVLTIFISIYLNSFLFKIMGAERINVIGTFQSVGATKGTVSFLFMGESIIYGVIGFITGIGLSYATLPKIYSMLNQFQVQTTVSINVLKPVNILIAFGAAIGISLISSIAIIISLNRLQVKDLIINTAKLTNKLRAVNLIISVICFIVSFAAYSYNKNYNMILGIVSFLFIIIGSILICPFIVKLLTTFVFKTLGRISGISKISMTNLQMDKFLQGNITLITVMVTMILTISIVITSVQASMKSMLNKNDFDISINNIGSDMSKYEKVKSVNGVDKMYYEYIAMCDGNVDSEKIGSVSLIGLSENQEFSQFHETGVKYDKKLAEKLQDGNYIMIDSFFANKNELKVGDKLSIDYEDKKDNKESEYEIIGFLDSSGFTTTRDAALISLDNMKKNVTKNPFQILIKLDNDDDKTEKEIMNILIDTPAVVKTIEQRVNDSMTGVDGLIIVLGVLMALVFVLVGFGVTNNLLISFLQRKKQIAVLCSVAMSNFQIAYMFLVETLTIFLISLGTSCLLSYTVCSLLPNILWGAGLVFQFTYSWEIFAMVSAILFILLLITTIVPSIGVRRMKIIDELKYQ